MRLKFSKRRAGEFARDRSGAAALEFAIVSVPLFWILFGMCEFGGMSLAQTNLDNALAETSRQIRTGELMALGLDDAAMKARIETAVCDNMNRIMMVDCDNLHLDVRAYTEFGGVDTAPPLASGMIDPDALEFEPGVANEVVLARAYYEWEVFTPMFSAIFGTYGEGTRLMNSAILFRNEPF